MFENLKTTEISAKKNTKTQEDIQKFIDAQISLGMRIDELTKDLVLRGFEGNGCGSGCLSQITSKIVMWIFRVRLPISCWWHDAGYSCSRSAKSSDHKDEVDSIFQHNMMIEMKTQKVNPRVARFISTRFRAAVLLKGHNAYWNG